MRNYPHHHHQKGSGCGYPGVPPSKTLPAKVMPEQFDPTVQNTTFTGQDVIIPVVHPSHTTFVNQTNYKYMHSFPHTQSVVNQSTCQHFCCPPRPHCF